MVLVTTLGVVLSIYILVVSRISPPDVPELNIPDRVNIAENHYTLGKNWLKKNEFGIWEMYIEGDAYERGLIYGKLSKELCRKQEDIFVQKINDLIPNDFFKQFLKFFIGFFNKDLPSHVPIEFQREIYGISRSFSDTYDYIAPKYIRHLNYHAAHDIGHALNDYSIVGCTSFALKGEKTNDGNLLIGRNFDFYFGDEFADDKLLLFMKPDKGFGFVSYSWAGFAGVVSGLNEKGLSVTINASKSDLPVGAKTPISLLAREILQYASTIDKAVEIAQKRETFVSEILMIGSKSDGKSILIEKSPSKLGVYDTENDQLICSNHYQSPNFKKDPINELNIKSSNSKNRYDRVKELLSSYDQLDVKAVASILRNQKGLGNDSLGMGNPMAINQLIAHHSVIIDPDSLLFYVSTNDFQLGQYIGYQLDKIFQTRQAQPSLFINKDPFVDSRAYALFKKYHQYKGRISRYLNYDAPLELTNKEVNEFIASNGELYITYELMARYYFKKQKHTLAKKYIDLAMTKSISSKTVEEELKALKQQL